jgi:hypothetical protein
MNAVAQNGKLAKHEKAARRDGLLPFNHLICRLPSYHDAATRQPVFMEFNAPSKYFDGLLHPIFGYPKVL